MSSGFWMFCGLAALGLGLWMVVGGWARRKLVEMLEDDEDDAIATADAVITAAYYKRLVTSEDDGSMVYFRYFVSYTYSAEDSSGRRYRGVVKDREVLQDVFCKIIQRDLQDHISVLTSIAQSLLMPHDATPVQDTLIQGSPKQGTYSSVVPGLTADVKYHHDFPQCAMLADNTGYETKDYLCLGWFALVVGVVFLLASLLMDHRPKYISLLAIIGAALEVLVIVFFHWRNYGQLSCWRSPAKLEVLDSEAESLVSGDSS